MRIRPKYLWILFISAAFITIFTESCTHRPVSAADLDEVCFEGEVLPVFLNSCGISGCHDNSSSAGYNLTSYDGILKGVERGNASSSKVYKVLTAIWSEEMMPPGQPLSIDNRTLIRVWIDQGANYTVCPEITNPEDTVTYVNPRACFDRDIFPVILSSCAVSDCHDNISAVEEYRLTSYNGIMELVVPGNPLNSKLYKVITDPEPDNVMPPPPYSTLSSAQIDSVFAWISYGATDEYCGEICDTISTVKYSEIISQVIVNSCRGCHSGATPSGAISLENYTDVSAVAATGQLLGVLKSSGYPLMPPAGSLSVCRIRQFELWIDDGFLNN